ncbi:MAG: 60S ribosomal export protein NMD3 [Thermoplasmata archaeon]|nr:60S ribosomal export protein NMD3 [Thermoplasmata archaeon]
MADGEFCVVCGRTDLPLEDGLCAECFANRTPLVTAPERPTIILCPTCGARKVGEHWERVGAPPNLLTAEDLTPLILVHPDVGVRTITWQETGRDAVQRMMHADVDVRFRGIERKVPVDVAIKVRAHACLECSRKTGHYYTALIQVRGMTERLHGSSQALRDRLEASFEGILPEAKGDVRRSMGWREDLPEGIDYYMVDTMAARALARLAKSRLNAELKESATLWGRKDGRDVYRVTFCLRVPEQASRRPPPPRDD